MKLRRRTLAATCRKMVAGPSGADFSPETALQRIARPDGDPVERAAQYALDFDPFRRHALDTFARLGNQLALAGDGMTFSQLKPDIAESATQLRLFARVLAERSPPDSVADLGKLAQRIAEAATEPAIVAALLMWHSVVRSAWIIEVSPEVYELRRHGTFQESGGFHGYTVGSALAMRSEAMGSAA